MLEGDRRLKSPASTTDLISLRLNNEMELKKGGAGLLSPQKRNTASMIGGSDSGAIIFNPTPIRSSKLVPTKIVTLPIHNNQAMQGQQSDHHNLNASRVEASGKNA